MPCHLNLDVFYASFYSLFRYINKNELINAKELNMGKPSLKYVHGLASLQLFITKFP